MATNGKKMFSVEINAQEALMIANACSMAVAAVKRSLVKETDQVIIDRRKASVIELESIANRVMYGGKEIL